MGHSYTFHQEGSVPGSCLQLRLPKLTTERVEELFGPHNWGNPRDDYSNAITVVRDDGVMLTLYMNHGEWRIGGHDWAAYAVEDFEDFLMVRG